MYGFVAADSAIFSARDHVRPPPGPRYIYPQTGRCGLGTRHCADLIYGSRTSSNCRRGSTSLNFDPTCARRSGYGLSLRCATEERDAPGYIQLCCGEQQDCVSSRKTSCTRDYWRSCSLLVDSRESRVYSHL